MYLEVPGADTRPGSALSTEVPDGRSTSLSVRTPDVAPGVGFSDAVLKALQGDRCTPADSLKVRSKLISIKGPFTLSTFDCFL